MAEKNKFNLVVLTSLMNMHARAVFRVPTLPFCTLLAPEVNADLNKRNCVHVRVPVCI